MTTYRPVDSKREEYRKYLERAGVMESLTRVLVLLYQEQDKGIDALEYVRNHLVENHPAQNSTNEDLRSQIADLVLENNMLRKRLSQYEEVPPPMSSLSPSKTQKQKLQPGDAGSVLSDQLKTSAPPRSNQSTEILSDEPASTSPKQK